VNLKDGRVLNGFVIGKSDRTLTLKTMTEKLTLDRAEITGIQELPQSLMPEGLLQSLGEVKVRDLLGYLMHPSQVPLPAETPTAAH
jgi:putative heme-binding domain-containing protein